MAPQAFLICSLFLLSSVVCLPLNSSPSSTARPEHSNDIHHTEEGKISDTARPEHSDDFHHTEEEKTSDKAGEKTTSTISEAEDKITSDETTDRDVQQAVYCNKTTNISINYTDYTIENGERKTVQKTHVMKRMECCRGYEKVGGLCRINLCVDKSCEDPNSKCVTVKRCGRLLPVFVTSTGIISTTCTQPKETQEHLNRGNTNTTLHCETAKQCGTFSNREVVCFNTKCDATSELTWLKVSGDNATCSDTE